MLKQTGVARSESRQEKLLLVANIVRFKYG